MMKNKEECFNIDFPEDGDDFVGNMFEIYSKGFDSGKSQIAKQELENAVNVTLDEIIKSKKVHQKSGFIVEITDANILFLAPHILKQLNKD